VSVCVWIFEGNGDDRKHESTIEYIRREQIHDFERMKEMREAMTSLREQFRKQQFEMIQHKFDIGICRANAKSIDDELEMIVHHVCNILQVLENVDCVQRRRLEH
jgi:hypothetical protein